MKKKAIAFCLASSLLLFGTTGLTAGLQNYSQTTHIPHQITTPDKVATPIGTLEFFDGVPIGKTTEMLYDYVDRARGVEVFINMTPAVSMYSSAPGNAGYGVDKSQPDSDRRTNARLQAAGP